MTGVHGFWAALRDSATLQGPVPAERWDADAYYSVEQAPGRSYARFAAFVRVRSPLHKVDKGIRRLLQWGPV